ncbi:uncharacterized protein LOC142353739 isoform X2 [Convolutriloba macropyga]|uniref:uncharacterized protein LOC142353739 isoform X2 n=1 Tax=Convolutriloba macropyga TaxID=536237 RepID=UPI003F524037
MIDKKNFSKLDENSKWTLYKDSCVQLQLFQQMVELLNRNNQERLRPATDDKKLAYLDLADEVPCPMAKSATEGVKTDDKEKPEDEQMTQHVAAAPERESVAESQGLKSKDSCPVCGGMKNLRKCSGCQRVSYCSKDHQKSDWKRHRVACEAFQKDNQKEIFEQSSKASSGVENVVVVVEIQSCTGRGISNHMINHLFESEAAGKKYMAKRFGIPEGQLETGKLTEMEFLTEIMKWTDCEMYSNPKMHDYSGKNSFIRCSGYRERVHDGPKGGERTLNGAAIYMGITLYPGFTLFSDLLGSAFFMGKRHGQYVTSNMVRGANLMIFDAIELFGSDDDTKLKKKYFNKWGRNYELNKWRPTHSCLEQLDNIYTPELDESTATGKSLHKYEYRDHRAK